MTNKNSIPAEIAEVLTELETDVEPGVNGYKEPTDDDIIIASNIVPKSIEWLWYPYMPIGMITTAEGSMDLGKSLTAVDLMVRLSKGEKLPDGTRLKEPVGCVYVTSEEIDFSEIIVPRLIMAGATSESLKRIALLGYIKDPKTGRKRPLDLTREHDLNELLKRIDAVHAGYIVNDPITSLLGKTNINQTGDVRSALAPIVMMAKETRTNITNIRHHRKSTEGGFNERGIGSPAFAEVARAGIAYMKDKTDETGERRLFIHWKGNNTEKVKPLAYRIVGKKYEAGRVEWLGESNLTEDEILDGATNKGALWQALKQFIDRMDKCMPTEVFVTTFSSEEWGSYSEANIKMTLSRMANDKSSGVNRSKHGEYCKDKTPQEWEEWNKTHGKSKLSR